MFGVRCLCVCEIIFLEFVSVCLVCVFWCVLCVCFCVRFLCLCGIIIFVCVFIYSFLYICAS